MDIPQISIREIKPINIEGGYLIDGFPSTGYTSAIATESLINTSQFELAGFIDSDSFPPVSIIKNGKPNYPSRIFVNNDVKVAVFSSYLTLHESLHRSLAKSMLKWAKEHKCSL
ncbi:MAG: PAC2 family protein, partial [Nitrosopumilaceae archaeon]